MSFEAKSNCELTVIIPAYQLHFRFPVQNKIHKHKILSDTRTGILACRCDFLPAWSDEFQKVWYDVRNPDPGTKMWQVKPVNNGIPTFSSWFEMSTICYLNYELTQLFMFFFIPIERCNNSFKGIRYSSKGR